MSATSLELASRPVVPPPPIPSHAANRIRLSNQHASYEAHVASSSRSSTGSLSSMTQAGSSISTLNGSQPPTPSLPEYAPNGLRYRPSDPALVASATREEEQAEARLRRQSLLDQIQAGEDEDAAQGQSGQGSGSRKRMSVDKQRISHGERALEGVPERMSFPNGRDSRETHFRPDSQVSLQPAPDALLSPQITRRLNSPVPHDGTWGSQQLDYSGNGTAGNPSRRKATALSTSTFLPPDSLLASTTEQPTDELFPRAASAEPPFIPRGEPQQQPLPHEPMTSRSSGHSKSLSGRLRALSQPGKQRPTIPPPPIQSTIAPSHTSIPTDSTHHNNVETGVVRKSTLR